MTRINQPRATEFRQNSTDRTNIQTIEMLATYGLITNWSRVVDADEKPEYTVVFADGTMEDHLRPNEAKWLLAGMADALRSVKFIEKQGA